MQLSEGTGNSGVNKSLKGVSFVLQQTHLALLCDSYLEAERSNRKLKQKASDEGV